MNIGFISQEYPPETHLGGIGTYTYNIATAFAASDHHVHVITSTNDMPRTLLEDGVWVHRIRRPRLRPNEFRHLVYAQNVERTLKRIDCSFDVVQASEFASEGLILSLKKRMSLITRLATPFFLTERLNKAPNWKYRPVWNWMERKQTLRSDGIFTSTKALAHIICQQWHIDPARIKVIPNSVDCSRIVRLSKGPLPDQLKDMNYLLYFGRLEERKGVRVLAKALPEVMRRFPDLSMVFIGTPMSYREISMRDVIEEEAKEFQSRLHFYDNLPQEDLFPIVKAAKLVILPSLWEAFGFVCIEAMALGRPVIATTGSGFEEIIEDDGSGFLVKPGHHHILADKIIDIINDDKLLCRIGRGAEERAHNFDVRCVIPRLLDYYEEVRENRQP